MSEHVDAIRILRCLTDEKSRPITLHIGYSKHLAAAADALEALVTAQEEARRLREDAERWRLLSPHIATLHATLAASVWPDEPSAHKRRTRDALIGQVSDSLFYSRWERCKSNLRDLLDAIDNALSRGEAGDAK